MLQELQEIHMDTIRWAALGVDVSGHCLEQLTQTLMFVKNALVDVIQKLRLWPPWSLPCPTPWLLLLLTLFPANPMLPNARCRDWFPFDGWEFAKESCFVFGHVFSSSREREIRTHVDGLVLGNAQCFVFSKSLFIQAKCIHKDIAENYAYADIEADHNSPIFVEFQTRQQMF